MRRNCKDGQRIWSTVQFWFDRQTAANLQISVNEIDDISLSQVGDTLKCENATSEGLLNLSFSPTRQAV